ncbi:MAG: hypothetical protein RIS80_933 [Actinomycetota bacterium]
MTEKKSTKGKAAGLAAEATSQADAPAKGKGKGKAAPAKKKKSVGFWIGITTGAIAVGLVGGVWIYGTYVFPSIQASNLDEKNVKACNLFYDGLKADKKDLKDAMHKVLVKVDYAIELYDPTYSDQDPHFGKVYEAMLRIADVGVAGLDFPELAVENFNAEIQRTEEICYAVLQEDRAQKLKNESNTN